MTWFKVDDSLHSSPKFHCIPKRQRFAAIGLWTIAGSWSANQLTDGRIPDHMIELWSPPPAAVTALVESGLWDRESGAYVFRNWHEYQPSRRDVEDERAASRERMREIRARRKQKKPQKDAENEDVFAGTTPNGSESVRNPRPDPTRPVVTNVTTEGATPSPRPRATRLPDGWIPTPELRAAMASECPDVDLALEHRKFTDHWKSQPGTKGTKLDWDATWRNWIRRSSKNGGRKQTAQQRITQSRALVEHPELDTANYDNTNPW